MTLSQIPDTAVLVIKLWDRLMSKHKPWGCTVPEEGPTWQCPVTALLNVLGVGRDVDFPKIILLSRLQKIQFMVGSSIPQFVKKLYFWSGVLVSLIWGFFRRNGKGWLRHDTFTEGKLSCFDCLCTAAKAHWENFIVHPEWKKSPALICQSAIKGQESSPSELICWFYLKSLAIIQIIISPLQAPTFG